MKTTYLLLFSMLLMLSCKSKIDNTNLAEVGKALLQGITQNDTLILNQLFDSAIDSLDNYDREKLREAINTFSNDQNYQIIKIDTSLSLEKNNIFTSLYVKKQNQYYAIYFDYFPDSSNTIKVKTFSFGNLEQMCNEENSQPYCPKYNIDFQEIRWTYSGRKFSQGSIVVKNNAFRDLTYLKFRVILRHGNFYESTVFFNQTIEHTNKIFDGDIVVIDVPGLQNYPFDFNIKKDEIFFSAELIEARPKPISPYCEKLALFQSEIEAK